MSWNLSTTGRHEDVLQAVRDYSGPAVGIRVPAETGPDVQLAQIEQVKAFVIVQLLSQGDKSRPYTISMAGQADASTRTVSISISSKAG